MKRLIILTALLLMSMVGAMAQTSAERWEAGNKAYIEGNYDKAIEEYTAILDGGVLLDSLIVVTLDIGLISRFPTLCRCLRSSTHHHRHQE